MHGQYIRNKLGIVSYPLKGANMLGADKKIHIIMSNKKVVVSGLGIYTNIAKSLFNDISNSEIFSIDDYKYLSGLHDEWLLLDVSKINNIDIMGFKAIFENYLSSPISWTTSIISN